MPTGLHDLLSYFSASGTCQLDTMILFGVNENVKVRNSEFLCKTSFDDQELYPNILGGQIPWQVVGAGAQPGN